MHPSTKGYFFLGFALLTCVSATTTTRTQVSGRFVGVSTSRPGAAATTANPLNDTQLGRSLMNPYNLFGNAGQRNNTDQEHYFSEIELERLCPPGNTEILKSIPRETTGCKTGNLDFFYQRCRCHYVKWLQCPPCPEIPELHSPSNNGLPSIGRSIGNEQRELEQQQHDGPHFVLGSANTNTTVVYQIPLFKSGDQDSNDSSADFATANKFSVYNSAGGIVNLYFYQTGQQQVVNTAVDTSNHTSNSSGTTREHHRKSG